MAFDMIWTTEQAVTKQFCCRCYPTYMHAKMYCSSFCHIFWPFAHITHRQKFVFIYILLNPYFFIHCRSNANKKDISIIRKIIYKLESHIPLLKLKFTVCEISNIKLLCALKQIEAFAKTKRCSIKRNFDGDKFCYNLPCNRLES
jgi:hypothetical protein